MQKEILSAVIRHDLTTIVIKGFQRQGRVVLTEVVVGSRAREIASSKSPPPAGESLASIIRRIRAYLDGSPADFSAISVELEHVSGFQKAVLLAARKIPYGKTVSYSELATMAGNPRAVRAAASVMRKNPVPIIIPCHRVIRSDGSPGAYAGDLIGEDAALKRTLLKLEKEAHSIKKSRL